MTSIFHCDIDLPQWGGETVKYFGSLCLSLALATAASALAAMPSAEEDAAIARSLATMLQEARTVISNNQDLINDPELGDKHLTGQVVLDDAVKGYEKTTGSDPRKIDANSRQGRLLRAMMDAIVAATDENQATINMNNNSVLTCTSPGSFIGIVNSSVPGVLSVSSNTVRGTSLSGSASAFTGLSVGPFDMCSRRVWTRPALRND